MRERRYSIIIIGILACGLTMAACRPHDPFCFHHPHGLTIVRYDWSQAPDATAVGGTTARFYRADDGTLVTTAHFTGRKGGSLHLNEGVYDVIAHNNDTECLHWRGTSSIDSLETFTREASLTEELPGFTAGKITGLVLSPDRLYGGYRERVSVRPNDTTVITLVPRKVTHEVIWEVEGVRGAGRVKACAATLAGVGGSLFLHGERTDRHGALMAGVGSRATVKRQASDDNDTGTFSGRFEVFGCPLEDSCSHAFTLYCWSAAGLVKASFDVKEQCHVIREDRKIYIKLKTDIEIPAGGGGAGFSPEVDDWGEVKEEIIL